MTKICPIGPTGEFPCQMISSVFNGVSVSLFDRLHPFVESVDMDLLEDELVSRGWHNWWWSMAVVPVALFWLPWSLVVLPAVLLPLCLWVLLRLLVMLFYLIDLSLGDFLHLLRTRQLVSFGMNCGASVWGGVRLKMLAHLRCLASIYHGWSWRLACVEGERDHLLLSFSTPEMSDLLEGVPCDSLSTLSALSTLRDLCILLRSEFIRLLLFRISSHPLLAGWCLVSLMVSVLRVHLHIVATQRVLAYVPIQRKSFRTILSTKEKLCMQLEEILEGLREGVMDEKCAARTLALILHQSCTAPPSEPKKEEPTLDPVPDTSSPQCTGPSDQLFVSYGTREEIRLEGEDGEGETVVHVPDVIHELKNVLKQRMELTIRKEKKLEGIDDEDVVVDNEQEPEKQTDKVPIERIDIHHPLHGVDIHSQLVHALRFRRGQHETVVGDSSDSDNE